ncbi:hypothetical protein [Methylocella sp.]|uniref:hypothetical protein n=1 Tax=Methylocella sp. TaxID=1978226 RepID=UPI0035AF6FE8
MSRRNDHLRVWGWPAALALLTVFGLLTALPGEDFGWRMLSRAALTIPLAVVIRYGAPGLVPRPDDGGEAARRPPE